MTTVGEVSGQLDLGRVIGGVYQVVRRNLVTFGGLALILTGIPQVLLAILRPGMMEGGTGAALFLAVALIAIALNFTLQGAVIYGVVRDLNNQPIRIAEGLAIGLRNFPRLLGVGLLFVLGVVVGCILLVVPGIILAVIWAAAVPALIIERTGVLGAFGRSADLTKGSRWTIFALGLLYAGFYVVVSIVVSILAGRHLLSADIPVVTAAEVLGDLILGVVFGVIGSALTAVLYVELRHAHEGVGPEAIAHAFDET